MSIISGLIASARATAAMGSVAISSGSIVPASIAISARAAITGEIFDQKKHRLEQRRDQISNQLKLVLIPLKGNRSEYLKLLAAIERQNKCSLLEHIRNVYDDQDDEELENMKDFYFNSLKPLDEESRKIILDHSHLMQDDGLIDIFNTFLKTSKTHRIQMEYWMDHQNDKDSTSQYDSNDFKENDLEMISDEIKENNCCTFHGYFEMYTQIDEVSTKLETKLKTINNTLGYQKRWVNFNL